MRDERLSRRALEGQLVRGYGFALVGILGWGGSQVAIRQGLSDLAPPLLGAAIALLWGSAFVFAVQARGMQWRGVKAPRGAFFFVVGGILASLGFTFNVIALKEAPVVLVAPITSINPLVTLVLVPLMLRGLERVTLPLFTGSALVVAGVALLTLANALD